MLFPRDSETREVKDLSGLWRFKADPKGEGRARRWFARPLAGTIPMPVPASYNDLTQDRRLRDHIGDVWYERTLWVPATWSGRRIVLRVGAAAHHATVYVNGREVARHKGGFLPFEADLTDIVRCGRPSRVTIAVNNVLDYTTLPPGWVKTFDDPRHPPGHRTQEYQFDFFNYAGLHRPVRLYATPRTYVEDITVVTDVRGRTGLVGYEVRVAHEQARAPRQAGVRVRLEDAAGRTVARGDGPKGRLKVPNARLWQPGKAYLYTLVAEAAGPDGRTLDVYRLPVGIRTVEVRGTKFLINRKPFYFKGFGKHEDMDIKGKGLDEALNSKDVALLKWIGANSFRTSHYPYSEEMMDLADREGLVVIDEAPAVGMNFRTPDGTFGPKVLGGQCLDHHLQVMRELVARDKNRPCVVMWSVANEPNTREDAAGEHFRQVIALVRRLDPTRPVTLVECLWPDSTKASRYVDVIAFNEYAAWYGDAGRTEVVGPAVAWVLKEWHKTFRKPVLVAEFGADAVAGLHQDPPVMWTEEYQVEVLREQTKAFDRLPFLIGEHVWNFADFMTAQGTGRVVGNRKGVFTRQRQPKAAAHFLRDRWTHLKRK